MRSCEIQCPIDADARDPRVVRERGAGLCDGRVVDLVGLIDAACPHKLAEQRCG